MAAALRSSVGLLALRRAAAAPAPPCSRLSSAAGGPAPVSTSRVRTRRHYHGNYDGSRGMYDAEAYSRNPVPRDPELDKLDWVFTAVAMVGAFAVGVLMEGGAHYFGWCHENNNARQPRMTSSRGRR